MSSLNVRASRQKALDLGVAVVGFNDIASNPYWRRMWTFQEYRLARTEPLLVCGTHTFSGSSAVQAQDKTLDDFIKTSRDFEKMKIKPTAETRALGEIWNLVATRHAKRATDVSVARAMTEMQSGREVVTGTELLSSLLGMTFERVCTDPRDKIYALYGLLPYMEQVSPPDYNKPARELMHEISSYVFRNEGSGFLEVISMFTLQEDRLTNTRYPSWVPNLTHPILESVSPHAYFQPHLHDEPVA